jgi:hypothetical protein
VYKGEKIMEYTFSLDELQTKELEEWKAKIKDLHGDEGEFKYLFIPCSLGCSIYVENSHVEKSLDLSHVERW